MGKVLDGGWGLLPLQKKTKHNCFTYPTINVSSENLAQFCRGVRHVSRQWGRPSAPVGLSPEYATSVYSHSAPTKSFVTLLVVLAVDESAGQRVPEVEIFAGRLRVVLVAGRAATAAASPSPAARRRRL